MKIVAPAEQRALTSASACAVRGMSRQGHHGRGRGSISWRFGRLWPTLPGRHARPARTIAEETRHAEDQAHRHLDPGRGEDREVLHRGVRHEGDRQGRQPGCHGLLPGRRRPQPGDPQLQERPSGRGRAWQGLQWHPPHRLPGREPRGHCREAGRGRLSAPRRHQRGARGGTGPPTWRQRRGEVPRPGWGHPRRLGDGLGRHLRSRRLAPAPAALPTTEARYHERVNESVSPAVTRVVTRAKDDPDVLAVMLFGSRARGEAGLDSDFDVCLVLTSGPMSDADGTQKRLDYLAEADLDLTIFQQLPLYVRSRVLREGKVLFVRDENQLYDVAIRSVKAWEDFRHIHRMYLDAVARG